MAFCKDVLVLVFLLMVVSCNAKKRELLDTGYRSRICSDPQFCSGTMDFTRNNL